MGTFYYGGWAPYVSVADRRRKAERMASELKKKGKACQPIVIDGRTIASTFWGKRWCDNLESYSDYANRLSRGRSYVRHGAVIDLQIEDGEIRALVSGSDLYEVIIKVDFLDGDRWQSIRTKCAGKIASLIELLQGRFSDAVMTEVTRAGKGLFPDPNQIHFRCSCPDSSMMCKHVAAVLYGVGARLDRQPELLFRLRHIDPETLLQQAGNLPTMQENSTSLQLEAKDLSALFGIELEEASMPLVSPPTPAATKQPIGKQRVSNLQRSKKSNAKIISTPTDLPTISVRRKREKDIRAADLISRGIPRHMIQYWLITGVLMRTDYRGIYRTTKQTELRISQYQDRRTNEVRREMVKTCQKRR